MSVAAPSPAPALSPPTANPHRGEAALVIGGKAYRLRPSFTALVAAEQELGPLFALVERAGEGRLTLHEMAALFWHCCVDPHGIERAEFAEGVAALGLAPCATPLRALLGQILQGSAPAPAVLRQAQDDRLRQAQDDRLRQAQDDRLRQAQDDRLRQAQDER